METQEYTSRRVVDSPDEIDGIRVENDYEGIRKAMDNGESVMHWEGGSSMFPILMHGEYCKIVPLSKEAAKVGDAVFCALTDKFGSKHYMVHRCTDIVKRHIKGHEYENWYRIESTWGELYGWTNEVYGVAHSTNAFEKQALEWDKEE